jgi:hypothetical protein
MGKRNGHDLVEKIKDPAGNRKAIQPIPSQLFRLLIYLL